MIKLMKLAKQTGELMAHASMELISTNSVPSEKDIFTNKQVLNCLDKLNKIKGQLIKDFPEERTNITKSVDTAISEFRENKEQKIEQKYRPLNATLDWKAVINTTDTHIPYDILLILSFGPKFIFPSLFNTDHMINLISNIQHCIEHNFPVETQEEAFKQASIQLSLHKNKHNSDIDKWLLFIKYRLSNFIKNNENLIIMKSDKGKHTVFLNRTTYVTKMEQLVFTTTDYVQTDSINLTMLEEKNNNFIDKLYEMGAVKSKFNFYDFATNIAQMYGLIKIHKADLPARPITSACGSPGFKLAKFLTNVLEQIYPEQGFHVINSLVAKEQITKLKIDADEILISFDVVSMFTNITVDLMLQIISERSELMEHRFNIPWNTFTIIFEFVLKECAVFSFNNTHYKQRDSLAMGSPLSPILAKILMTRILEFTLIQLGHTPKFIALYVDDSLWILKRDEAEFVLDTLNHFHERIKFTMEKESNNTIKFLDLIIQREGGEIITCWHKKDFASSRLLNYFSNHNHTCIMQTAIAYVKMALRLSHESFFNTNKAVLTETLRLNSFPEDVIIRIMHDNYTLMRPIVNTIKRNLKYASVLHEPFFSNEFKRRVDSLHPDIKLTTRPNADAKNPFSFLKDKTDITNKTNIILTLRCNCNKYIDIRHTMINEKADCLIKFCKETYNTNKGKCMGTNHKFNKWKFINCSSFSLTNKKFQALIHVHRDKLCFPQNSSLHYKLKKHLCVVTETP